MRLHAKVPAAMAVLLALAGCGTPNPRLVRPIEYPPEAKIFMLNQASKEWRDWGSPVFDAQGRRIGATTANSYMREDQPAAFPKVQGYWMTLDGQEAYIVRQRLVYKAGAKTGNCQPDEQNEPANDHLWGCLPWSAAFISFVMRTAGIHQNEFAPGAGHRVYVDYLDDLARSARDRNLSPMFEPFEVSDYAPRAGDLVCADRTERAARRITTLAERRAERRDAAVSGKDAPGRLMHCDIVMSVERGAGGSGGLAYVLGGNVQDTVACVAHPIDGGGHLSRDGGRTWFAVFRNNIPDPPVRAAAAPLSSPAPSLGCARPTGLLVSGLAR